MRKRHKTAVVSFELPLGNGERRGEKVEIHGNVLDLLLREKSQTGVNNRALAQRAKRGQTKLVIKFGLSRKNDLKEFTARSLEIELQ